MSISGKCGSSSLQVPVLKPMELMVEASPRRVFANAHTYHVNSISVNSDAETYLSADDLRINLWNLDITDCSFSILQLRGSEASTHPHLSEAALVFSPVPQTLLTSNQPTWRS